MPSLRTRSSSAAISGGSDIEKVSVMRDMSSGCRAEGNNRVIWALPMSQGEIERGRARDRHLIDDYFGEQPITEIPDRPQHKKRPSLLARVFRWPQD
jgi:hypothetical protein